MWGLVRLEIIMSFFFAIILFYNSHSLLLLFLHLLLFSNYAPKNLNSQTLTMNAIIKNIK